MWPFSKKWTPPEPRLGMVVALASQELPSLMALANPCGEGGAVQGMAGPAEQEPTPENMVTPLQEGDYVAISPGGGSCSFRVDRADPNAKGLSLAPESLPAAGLTEEMLGKFNQPAWRVMLQMDVAGKEVPETVLFATRFAQRLAVLADGIVLDRCAYRFFGPAGWPVEDPIGEIDAREHVHIHIESGGPQDPRWFHTHGLIKFGRPEMEIYDVPPEMDGIALAMLLETAQYLINSAVIAPGETMGDPNQPFCVCEGTKNRAGHWEDMAVLELVDLDDRRKPVSSGAPKALQAFKMLGESQQQ